MHNNDMALSQTSSHLSGESLTYVEELYDLFLTDANAISQEWREAFEKLPRNREAFTPDISHSAIREHFLLLAKSPSRLAATPVPTINAKHEKKQIQVLRMINAYRVRGHQMAQIDPLGLMDREPVPDLDLRFHGLSEADYDTSFQLGSLFFPNAEAPLRDIISDLKHTYCSTVGAEFMYIVETQEKRWIQSRLEPVRGQPVFAPAHRRHILERLTAAEGLEKYLASRFAGAKRFGLEGGESLIPCLDGLIQRAGKSGIQEIGIGMAHRGRLNVLVNIFGKNPRSLFDEFEGKRTLTTSGDVKYHQGFSSSVTTPGGEVYLALGFNPSHLEIVAPVVEGSVRARQDRRGDPEGNLVLPIILHGDAAFSGQGVVMETLQMSQTRAFKTGGTFHIVINNQVGFTTSRQDDLRSTEYCTDVAKMVQAPIFHVNADDPEAVAFVTQVALDYRNEFHKDVVIDLICYRRRGHNEADEPSGTQPMMYQQIKQQKTTRALYAEKLIADGVISTEECQALEQSYRQSLEEGRYVAKGLVTTPNPELFVDWTPFLNREWTTDADTQVDAELIQSITKRMAQLPPEFSVQRQVAKIMGDRKMMATGAIPINWGFAEIMAYATLLKEGYPVRITGQDVGRGTFSHRHAVLHNQKNGDTHVPLKNVSEEQACVTIFDSFLSEEAALAFEYGYATVSPNALVVWEAQFGDFANGAQVVIDQFIASGEHKWARLCGLTMLLPHGYEGQGPEHSSARLERYLQLCAEHNIQVCVPSTPAQVFHMLRRQVIRPLRKPLIVMSPKSLLRHKQAVSTLEELTEGSFQTVISEVDALPAKQIKRAVLCSGKVYYDLYNKREADGTSDVAIIRLEQLYPFPEADLNEALKPFGNLETVVWCQEEPLNQGAWYCSQHHLRNVLHDIDPQLNLSVVARTASAAPASGYMSQHIEEQEQLVNEALNG